MFKLKNCSYGNIYWNILFEVKYCTGYKCLTGQSFIQFLWGTTDWVHNQNVSLLDWVCRLLRKNKLFLVSKLVHPAA